MGTYSDADIEDRTYMENKYGSPEVMELFEGFEDDTWKQFRLSLKH